MICRFNIIPIKIPHFSVKTGKLILKFIQNFKRPSISKPTLKKENKVGGLTVPHFKTFYSEATVKSVSAGMRTDLETNGVGPIVQK